MGDGMSAVVDEVIRTEGLTKVYPGGVRAVDDLDLSVRRGEIFGLVGPDGAGKTTTLRLICGLMYPTEGSVIIDGRYVVKQLDEVKDRVKMIVQRKKLQTHLEELRKAAKVEKTAAIAAPAAAAKPADKAE